MNRRGFLRACGTALVSSVWPGSSVGEPQSPQPTEIVFSFGPDDSGALRSVVDAFNSEYEGKIHVTWWETARDSDAYYRQLLSVFLAGAGDVDVIGADVVWTADFATNDWVLDLTRQFEEAYDPEAFLPAPLASTRYLYRTWGVPWFTDAGMLFYRRDLLAQSGFTDPPATWSELQRMARRVMQKARTQYGFVFQAAEYEGGVANALEYIWSAGGRVLTGNLSVAPEFGQSLRYPNVITVDSPASARGFDIARDMIDKGLTPEGVTTFRELESQAAFLSGDAVFMRNWPYVYGIVDDPDQSAVEPEQVGVAPLPSATPEADSYGCLGGWNLMINAKSDKNKREAAWTFIRYLTAAAQQKKRALIGGFLPTLRKLYDDPDMLSSTPSISLGRRAIANARVRPTSPYYQLMSPRIAHAFNRRLRGDISGALAVRGLQRELQNIMRKHR